MQASVGNLIEWEKQTINNLYEGFGLVIAMGNEGTSVNHMTENSYRSTEGSIRVRWIITKGRTKKRFGDHLDIKHKTDKPLDGFVPTMETWVPIEECKVLS